MELIRSKETREAGQAHRRSGRSVLSVTLSCAPGLPACIFVRSDRLIGHLEGNECRRGANTMGLAKAAGTGAADAVVCRPEIPPFAPCAARMSATSNGLTSMEERDAAFARVASKSLDSPTNSPLESRNSRGLAGWRPGGLHVYCGCFVDAVEAEDGWHHRMHDCDLHNFVRLEGPPGPDGSTADRSRGTRLCTCCQRRRASCLSRRSCLRQEWRRERPALQVLAAAAFSFPQVLSARRR